MRPAQSQTGRTGTARAPARAWARHFARALTLVLACVGAIVPAHAYARATVFRTSFRRANTFPIQNGYRELAAALPLNTYDCDNGLTTSMNLALQSNTITTSPWTLNGFTATQGDATCNPDPFGGNAAWRVTGTVSDSYDLQAFTGLVIGQSYSWSIYTKKATDNAGSPAVSIYFQAPSNAPASMTLGTSWARTALAVTASTNTGSVFIGGGSTFTSADGPICVYGGQMEPGATASTYSATTTNPFAVSALKLDGNSVIWRRASSATCTKNNGTLVTLGANQPRCNALGCLPESGTTNVSLASQDITAAAWNVSSGGSSTAPTRTADTSVAPDGTTTADRVQTSVVTGGADQSVIFSTTPFTATAAPWTFSCWIKGTSASGSIPMQFARNTFAASAGQTLMNYTTSWQRFSTTGTLTAALWVGVIGYAANGTVYATGAGPVRDFQIWGCQIETGSVATSYIATGATAVARGPDFPSVLTPALVSDRVGCVSVTSTPYLSSLLGTFIIGGAGTGALVFLGSSTQLGAYDGTNALASNITSALGRSVTARAGWSATSSLMELGEAGAAMATSAYDGSILTSFLYLGARSDNTLQLPGYVGNLRLGNSSQGCR